MKGAWSAYTPGILHTLKETATNRCWTDSTEVRFRLLSKVARMNAENQSGVLEFYTEKNKPPGVGVQSLTLRCTHIWVHTEL